MLRGYVDSGSKVVTLRESDAISLGLPFHTTQIRLNGYAGGSVVVKHKIFIDLNVDLARAKVEALVVPDCVQKVSIIVGQPFINHPGIVMVIYGGQVRLFNSHKTPFLELNELPPRKITLWAKETTVIPPNHIGHISLYTDQGDVNEVFIDLQQRTWPTQFHVIPRCVIDLSKDAVVPILNTSDNPVCYAKGRVVARASLCSPEIDPIEMSVCSISQEAVEYFSCEDLNDVTDSDINPESKNELLTLINKYRDCFATKTSELVHTDASKIGIGGILLQVQENGELKPVQYFSRATTKQEQVYHSYELETLAVVCSMKKFRIYLIGIEFKVITDCNALRTTLTKRDLIPRIGRWWLTTQEFNFSIEYRAGSKMNHVDALSRNPTPGSSSDQTMEAELLHVEVTDSDWVLAAQLNDERCKEIHQSLSREPVDESDRRVHNEYALKDNRVYRKTTQGLRWVPRGVNDAFLTSEISETQPVNHMEIRSEVVKRIQEQQSTQKKYYDRRHAKEKTFAVGQQVLVHRVKCSNDGQSKKLEPRYQGPFTVTAVLTNDRYVVEDLKGTERCRKPYKGICPSDKLKAFNTVVSSSESETDAENSHA
ncbi:hypothetical protein NQ315_012065 [Exocentrus adspersus]|uniref:Reverse transcriptase RNase H-like domain-containing protein n=1 Tax=Exocentrus adspersus TaxID=1586481 RepID=A0AAV8VY79_9CUCU|nr:hypothetical protein NQ315_012065 [Exocentrus adspersus]